MGNAEGTREKQQVSLGAPDGEELGDLFSNEDVQHRDQEERDRDPARMEEFARLIVGGENKPSSCSIASSASQPTARLAAVMPICVSAR